MRILKGVLVLGLVAMLAGPGFGTSIDFEDLAVAPGGNSIGGDRVSNGFLFDSSTNHTHLANDSFGASNGTTYLVIDDFMGLATMTMSSVSGASFAFREIDISEWNTPGEAASAIRITGNYAGGGSVASTVVLDGVFDGVGGAADFEHFTFGAEWTGLSSVVFDAVAGSGSFYYAIDNISSVPEPGTLALVALGLAGVGLAARRRRRS